MQDHRAFVSSGIRTALFIVAVGALALHVDAAEGYLVQVAAYRTENDAWSGWRILTRRHPDLLGTLTPFVERVVFGGEQGTFFRLQAGPLDTAAEAAGLCARLKERGQDCWVVERTVSAQRVSSAPSEGVGSAESVEETQPAEERPSFPEPVPTEAPEDSGRGVLPVGELVPPQTMPPQVVDDESAFEPGDAPSGGRKGFVQGLLGVTFETETAGFTAGSAGANLTPRLEVIGEVGYLWNVLPTSEESAWNEGLSPLHVDVRAPFFYGLAGLRFVQRTKGLAHPYVFGSAGLARGRLEFRYESGGRDITTDIAVVTGDGLVRTEHVSTFLVSLGGGVTLSRGNGPSLDVGYQFMRLFQDELFLASDRVNFGRLYVGLGYAF